MWAYFALIACFAADAKLFASTRVSPGGVQAVILIILWLGLYAESRLCRRLLVIYSITGAFGILTIQGQTLHVADVLLAAMLAAQAALLCTPGLRGYTTPR